MYLRKEYMKQISMFDLEGQSILKGFEVTNCQGVKSFLPYVGNRKILTLTLCGTENTPMPKSITYITKDGLLQIYK